MHPTSHVLNFDDQREFQNRRAEHMHALIHIVDAPKIDGNEDSEVVEFIDKYFTWALPDVTKYPEMSNLVKKVQTHHHKTTCRKKKGVPCRFNAPWAPSSKTRIICSEEKIDETIVNQSEKLIEKILSYIVTISDLSDVTLSQILEECGVTAEQYDNALGCVEKKVSILFKRKPSEVNIGPYNTVILKLLKGNMNLQFVTGVYAMLTYLMSYLCKPEHAMSEPMKKASKEAYEKDIEGRTLSIGNTFLTKRKVSTHEAIKRVLSLPMRHTSIDVLYVPTGLKKNRTKMVKSLSTLETMHPDDTNIFASNIIGKYENQLDNLHSMCLADFASSYVSKKVDDLPIALNEIRSYTISVSNITDVKLYPSIIVLKNGLGEMQECR